MNKIDFIFTIEVENANPNGDPLADNMPRTDIEEHGIISDVCIKRKIRNRLQDMGEQIFVKSNEKSDDGCNSLEERYSKIFDKKSKDVEIITESCKRWIDVRTFGQVFTYDSKAIGIRGPLSINIAKSLNKININTMQITKSVNGQKKPEGKSSDTIGSKVFIDYGVYVVYGSINSNFAEKTGFTKEDSEKIKEAIRTLFVNDASSARPDGSMRVKDIFWFNHSSSLGDMSSYEIKQLFKFDETEENIYEKYNIRIDKENLNDKIEMEYIKGI